MKFTEQQLHSFAAPLSETENQLCQNAISMVRDALIPLGFSSEGRSISPLYSDTFAYSLRMLNKSTNREVKIFIQGSYANNTNVRSQSDVDIAIVQEERFYTKYRSGVSDTDYHFSSLASPLKSFKDEIQSYLEAKFGNDVERGNISIKVHGNSYRKDADTVPCIRYRDYSNDYINNPINYVGGIRIEADDGHVIINYPEQHIENGKNKNNETKYTYKRMVRIAKKIRNLMVDAKVASADNVTSFGLESLLWNIPNEVYLKYSSIYRFTFDEVLIYLRNNKARFNIFKEANGIKLLCPTSSDIQTYQAFVDDISALYEYDIHEA